jgi:hypothetical protein
VAFAGLGNKIVLQDAIEGMDEEKHLVEDILLGRGQMSDQPEGGFHPRGRRLGSFS